MGMKETLLSSSLSPYSKSLNLSGIMGVSEFKNEMGSGSLEDDREGYDQRKRFGCFTVVVRYLKGN